MTAVVNVHAKCRQIEDARRMFDRMPERDFVAWNAIIYGLAHNGPAKRALEFVFIMQREGIGPEKRPDSITFVSVFEDHATGKGAATTEDVLDDLTRNEDNEDTSNLGMDFVEMEQIISTASTNNEGTSQKETRRRSTDNMD
ncbi:hypothetical protein MRB53_029998 [Persea americana]|uniref:Uncharacterized protein n=1 Tax=Persea americana TaxID=3435 RepID=A0ACC2KJW4_PERAE|nr:hypothetical protein MRB53_029998 [Persea americana]